MEWTSDSGARAMSGTGRGGGWPGSDRLRRCLDVVVSGTLGLIVIPIILLTALGSAMALRAWPFFVQDRVGRGGELFRFVKVRTLPLEVPRYTDKHELANHHIPPFCRFLRAFHLDELPQVYLVLRGRMSLVGPRPEMAKLHERMHPLFAAERTAVRPGCTGLWQISHACGDLIGSAPEFDRFYLQNRTVRLDLWVLGRTMLQMTGLTGLISLDQVPAWTLPARTADVYVLDLNRLERSLEAGSAETSLGIPVAAGR